MQEVYDFLKKCGTYYLATVEGNRILMDYFQNKEFDDKFFI